MLQSVEKLRGLSKALLRDHGVSSGHAAVQTDALIEAELCGQTRHGLLRLLGLLESIATGACAPEQAGIVHHMSSGMIGIDGRCGLGPVVGSTAVAALLESTRQAEVVAATLTKCSDLGSLAPYVETLAQKGIIGIALSPGETSAESVEGRHASSNLGAAAIATPTDGGPLVVEFANGEAKGSTYGLAFELMIAAIAGSAVTPLFQDALSAAHRSAVFIAMAPSADPGLPAMLAEYLGIFGTTSAGNSHLVLAQDENAKSRRERILRDGIPIDPALWRELQRLALGVRAA